MKVTILGATGMLGHTVSKYFIEQYGRENTFLTYRNLQVFVDEFGLPGKQGVFFDPLIGVAPIIPLLSKSDFVINCIGLIKQRMSDEDTLKAIQINSVFPWTLARLCKSLDCRLIHITTDCVFSGSDGGYDEYRLHDCTDVYGKTKSLGEPTNCMVLRTSIIGEELHGNVSLVEWAKSQKGKMVDGYVSHFWNGVTTYQFSKICHRIIEEDLYQEELFHIFSNDISKYELLKLLNSRFDLDLIINRQKTVPIDRRLCSYKSLNKKLNIPSIEDQIKEM